MTWEYLAGFFDGEGCIHYARRSYGVYGIVHVSQGEDNESRSHVLAEILEFLVLHGIKARYVSYDDRRAHRVLASSVRACRAWVEGMLPFLRVKKQAAEDYLDSMPVNKLTRISLETRTNIIDLRENGESITKIASRLKINKTTVKYNLIKYSNYRPFQHSPKKYNPAAPKAAGV